MATEPLRVIVMNGSTYNIGRLSPENGSWIVNRLMKTFREYISTLKAEGNEPTGDGLQEPEGFAETLLTQLTSELPEADYKRIQKYVLATIVRVDSVGDKMFEQPIILASGLYAYKDLAEDIFGVVHLTNQALIANLAPLFTRTGLVALMRGERV
jgi:hypothetical protein